MTVIPAGSFMMGSPDSEKGHDKDESPQHKVTFKVPLAVAIHDVTFDQYDACVAAGACTNASEAGWGRDNRPVINVSWQDAQDYAAWLSSMTGQTYRLLTEAEWEYAARAGSTKAYFWGDEIGQGNANCRSCGSEWDYKQTSPVGSFKPNAFGLYDMAGNVFQWVQDCYAASYENAPNDGTFLANGDCKFRVVRGGSWSNSPGNLRAASRDWSAPGDRYCSLGFRVVSCCFSAQDAFTSYPLTPLPLVYNGGCGEEGGPGGFSPLAA